MTFNIFLAVRFVHRSHRAALPDIPTAAEYVPGYEASGLLGGWRAQEDARRNNDKLNKKINAAIADPAMKTRLTNLSAEPMLVTPAN